MKDCKHVLVQYDEDLAILGDYCKECGCIVDEQGKIVVNESGKREEKDAKSSN